MTCPTNLTELYDALARHDWFYTYSDDSRVYFAGQKAFDHLRHAAQALPGGEDLLVAYAHAILSHTSLPARPAPLAEAA